MIGLLLMIALALGHCDRPLKSLHSLRGSVELNDLLSVRNVVEGIAVSLHLS